MYTNVKKCTTVTFFTGLSSFLANGLNLFNIVFFLPSSLNKMGNDFQWVLTQLAVKMCVFSFIAITGNDGSECMWELWYLSWRLQWNQQYLLRIDSRVPWRWLFVCIFSKITNRFTKIHYLCVTGGMRVCLMLMRYAQYVWRVCDDSKLIPVFIYSTWIICYICNASVFLFFSFFSKLEV